jgi:peptidoglycan/xylan/chitin deacetylase (PgdA/CDA1 family)
MNPSRSRSEAASEALSRRTFLAAVAALSGPLVAGCGSGSQVAQGSAPAATQSTSARSMSAQPAAPADSNAPVGGPAEEVTHASSGRPEVALTFHGAGELGLARQVLSVFADRDVAVTVLAVGTWLQQYPDGAKLVADHGHELGNHTWSHRNLANLPSAAIQAEIERCRDRLVALTGDAGAFFRPSAAQHATEQVLRLAGTAGYSKVLSYDIDSRDFTDPGPASIRRNVRAASAGSVVSLHLGHPGTLEAIPGVLDDLSARSLTPVTATQLFR